MYIIIGHLLKNKQNHGVCEEEELTPSEELEMDLLHLSISDEDGEVGGWTPYFILGKWMDLVNNEKG